MNDKTGQLQCLFCEQIHLAHTLYRLTMYNNQQIKMYR